MCRLLLVLITTLVMAASDPNPEPEGPTSKDVLKKLQGEWKVIKASKNGIPTPKELENVKMVVKDNKMTIHHSREESVTIKVDPKKKPAEIDVIAGPTMTVLGIYKLEKDEFSLYLSKPGGMRPTKFDEKGANILVIKRKK